MSNTINFGIDLGTTNSLIARCENGVVEVFRNPAGHKETLPSVVAFRRERVLVGDKAREYIEKDPSNVFSYFKRKMGTSEKYFVPNLSDFRTPIALSAMVLKELRNFIYTEEVPRSVVITIPASFDTVQSNATKHAGYDAGFDEVVLLQEPIAASLAFANKGGDAKKEGTWLVYDLGGGTFDIAMVTIADGEMRVVDHEGNNYLGGLDFDELMVDMLIVPYLMEQGSFSDLTTSLKSASGTRNALYYELLYKAEEAKVTLSNKTEAEIEFEIVDDEGEEREILLTVTRAEFEAIIGDKIDETIALTRSIMARQGLSAADIKEAILIGGSTYIPYVRNSLRDQLGLAVNVSVDPTTAVAVGAAYFAGAKSATYGVQKTGAEKAATDGPVPGITVRMAYQKNTNDKEVYFTALVTGATEGMSYRITRADGGFDSGLKKFEGRVEELLLLLPDTLNEFQLRFSDQHQVPIQVVVPPISIVQGKYSLYGQPLPNDICLEVDDQLNNVTHMEVLFEKNEILPLKKTITKTLSRTIVKGSEDQLLINVLEGSRFSTAQSNLPVGVISIKGTDIERDLIKGSDVDLTIEITESRDIHISAYVNITDKEYKEVFSPTARNVNVSRLREEVEYLLRVAHRNLNASIATEDYDGSARLHQVTEQLEAMLTSLVQMTEDDVTDLKYKLEDQKRKIAKEVDTVGRDGRLRETKEEYYEWKAATVACVAEVGDAALSNRLERVIRDEAKFIEGSESMIKRKTDELRQIRWDVKKKDLDYISGVYLYYAMKDPEEYRDPDAFEKLVERGDASLQRRSVEELLAVIYNMYELLIDKELDEPLKGTGLS